MGCQQAKGQAIDVVPLGGVKTVRIKDEKYKGKALCFELKAESVGLRDFTLCADSEEDLQKWISALFAVQLRRVKVRWAA